MEKTKFTYSPLGKAFEKQIKIIEDQKQVEALNTLKSNNQLTTQDLILKNVLNNDEAKKELDKIKEIEKNVNREKIIYEKNEYTYSFMRVKSRLKKLMNIKPIYELKSRILGKIRNQRVKKKNNKNKLFLKTRIIFLRVEKKFLTLFTAKYFR